MVVTSCPPFLSEHLKTYSPEVSDVHLTMPSVRVSLMNSSVATPVQSFLSDWGILDGKDCLFFISASAAVSAPGPRRAHDMCLLNKWSIQISLLACVSVLFRRKQKAASFCIQGSLLYLHWESISSGLLWERYDWLFLPPLALSTCLTQNIPF